MRRSWVFLLLFVVPLAAAQNASTDQLPVGNESPDPDESTEGAPGIAFGTVVLVGTVAFAAAFAYAAFKYSRRPPSQP